MEQQITFDKRNYRKHSEKNKAIIRKSLQELGAGRSVLIDKDGALIAGNGVYEQAQKLNIPVRVVESDGSELVVVKRTDLATGDEKRKKLALADNAASDTSEFDNGLLLEDFSIQELADFGIMIKDTERLSGIDYEGIYYEPQEKPNITLRDCIDTTKFDAKVRVIEDAPISDEMKATLKMFAYRFLKIDFENVANYYAYNASDEEKKVIERLRLVLVDGGVEGFVEDDMLRIHDLMISDDE